MSSVIIKRSLFLALLALGLSARADFSMPIEGRLHAVAGAKPARPNESSLNSAGTEAALYLTPLLAWEKSRWYLSGGYDFEYSNVNNVIKIDEDLYNFVQQMTNTIELGGGYRRPSGSRLALKAFGVFFNGKEASDDRWMLGPYDYRDRGGKVSWTQVSKGLKPYQWTVGVKITDRLYPNYTSLDEKRRHDKDQQIAKLYFDGNIDWGTGSHFLTAFSYSLQKVDYSEAVVVDESGTTNTAADGSGTLRKDWVHSLSLDMPWDAGAHQHFSVGYALELRRSNLNQFDQKEFVYTPNYNDYNDHALNLAWSYDFNRWGFLKSPQVMLEGSAAARLYDQRLSKDKDGVHQTPKQVDSRFEATLGLNSAVSENFSTDISLNYMALRSNNADESTSLVNYNFVTLRLGGQFAF